MANDEVQKQAEYDGFIASTIYPQASSVFALPKSLQSVKNDCVVVIDTNALLVPYLIGKNSLDQIRQTYKKLAEQNRLIIPGQVSREFAKHRAGKIAELFQQLNRKKNTNPLQRGLYPLLETLPDYQESVRLEIEIDQLLQEYRKSLSKVLDHIQEWLWSDPVSQIYGEAFGEACFLDPVFDRASVLTELRMRYQHKIPPGYKDGGKEDEGIGDLLIWKTILNIGEVRQLSAILVSGEEKADWRLKSDGQTLYPRYELVNEFRRHSEGQSFHILQFSRFLELFGASAEVVQEVQQSEVSVTTILSDPEMPSTLEQVLAVCVEVLKNQKEYVEAVRVVAAERDLWWTTVSDKCTRRIGLDTATFKELLQDKDSLESHLKNRFPDYSDHIHRKLT
jgi:hypothetical protein